MDKDTYDELKAEQAKWARLDNRRTTGGPMGASPTVDSEAYAPRSRMVKPSTDSDATVRAETDCFPHRPEQGFWKKSEDLACRAGMPMKTDERGLPPGYAQNHPFVRKGVDYPSKGEC